MNYIYVIGSIIILALIVGLVVYFTRPTYSPAEQLVLAQLVYTAIYNSKIKPFQGFYVRNPTSTLPAWLSLGIQDSVYVVDGTGVSTPIIVQVGAGFLGVGVNGKFSNTNSPFKVTVGATSYSDPTRPIFV